MDRSVESVKVENWAAYSHPRWEEARRLIRQIHPSPRVLQNYEPSEYFATVALNNEKPIGYHIFRVQPIGPEFSMLPLLAPAGDPLKEARGRDFWLDPEWRGIGIGTKMQLVTVQTATDLGCYQLRSRSSLDRKANYAIKLKLGFTCLPVVRGNEDGTQDRGF
ncbi:MAG: GNAT family N-acetyltransferase [Chloroflexota bacterium]